MVYPVYKRIKIAVEFCPICDAQLLGNNSLANPWYCRCGVWEYNYSHDKLENRFEIRPRIKGEEYPPELP